MRPDSHSATSSRIVVGIGLVLTVWLFSGYRPWGNSPVNAVFLLGPVILAAGAASHFARHSSAKTAEESPKRGTSARRVTGLGLVMLLLGGCPWLYTPLFTGGESNSSSGLLGTVIFLLIGLPGLAVTAIGLINLVAQRKACRNPGRAGGRKAMREVPMSGLPTGSTAESQVLKLSSPSLPAMTCRCPERRRWPGWRSSRLPFQLAITLERSRPSHEPSRPPVTTSARPGT